MVGVEPSPESAGSGEGRGDDLLLPESPQLGLRLGQGRDERAEVFVIKMISVVARPTHRHRDSVPWAWRQEKAFRRNVFTCHSARFAAEGAAPDLGHFRHRLPSTSRARAQIFMRIADFRARPRRRRKAASPVPRTRVVGRCNTARRRIRSAHRAAAEYPREPPRQASRWRRAS